MEIWNLVFIQDRIDASLEVRRPLCPQENVDTGSSLERVATVLQGVDNVFQTDLFRPTLEVAESLSGRRARRGSSGRRLPEDASPSTAGPRRS